MRTTWYFQLASLEHIYLEDSYVTGLMEAPTRITFSLEVVLTEHHPLYHAPPTHEQYCYRAASLLFPAVHDVRWVARSFQRSIDGGGTADYGNIDEFYVTDNVYVLAGDWGCVHIQSDLPVLQFIDG